MRAFVDVTLSQSDKRLIFIFLFVFIIIFILIGLIGVVIRRITKLMETRMDYEIHEAVIKRVISTPEQLRKYGSIKNRRRFFLESIPVFCIIIASVIAYLVNSFVTGKWADTYFANFGDLFYQWDWDNAVMVKVFGFEVLSEWPAVSNAPHIEVAHIGSYVLCLLWILAMVYLAIVTQAFIARGFLLNRRCHTVFGKSLEGFNYFQDDKEKGAPNVDSTPKK